MIKGKVRFDGHLSMSSDNSNDDTASKRRKRRTSGKPVPVNNEPVIGFYIEHLYYYLAFD